jgi:hypothetical protein
LLRIVNEKVGIEHIESAPVYFVLLMGLPMAVVFTIVVVGYILRILKGTAIPTRIGVSALLLVDLSNNAFATKSVDVLILSILVVGLGRANRETRTPVKPPVAGPCYSTSASITSNRPARLRV